MSPYEMKFSRQQITSVESVEVIMDIKEKKDNSNKQKAKNTYNVNKEGSFLRTVDYNQEFGMEPLFLKDIKDLKQRVLLEPKTINIFDFDQTLFRSPLPNPALWDTVTRGYLISEEFGWFQNLLTLPKKHLIPLSDWFIPSTIRKVKESIDDVNSITVLLTGRDRSIFNDNIKCFINEFNLQFDLMILKEKLYFNNTNQKLTTLSFKKLFISELLNNFKQVNRINIYDDRLKHISSFETYLEEVKQHLPNIIYSSVMLVESYLKHLDMDYEKYIVEQILNNMNSNQIMFKQKKGKYPIKVEIVRRAQYLGVMFSKEITKWVYDTFAKNLNINKEWTISGDHITLGLGYFNNDRLLTLGVNLNQRIQIQIIGYRLYQQKLIALKVETTPKLYNINNRALHITLCYNPNYIRPKEAGNINHWVYCKTDPKLNLKFYGFINHKFLDSFNFIY